MHRLGPFTLHERLARGGTATVWRASWAERPHAPGVAIKVLTESRARDPWYHDQFRREVRAAASLVHPSISAVIDYGRVAADQATTDVPAGSPWLAMELGDGTLHASCGELPWDQIRPVLLQLLDALAHAHARGIVHRDVKPRNVLWLDGQVKLSDFGLAHVLEEQGEAKVVGTPSYMAPEHFAGSWRDYGPWTDLYSLGCLAWHLICGQPPFGTGRSVAVLHQAHRTWPAPALQPRSAVPEGLEAWIHRLMAKSPADRYRRAADARWALEQLSDPVALRAAPAPLGPAEFDAPTVEVGAPVGEIPAPLGTTPTGPAPFPASYARPERRGPRLQLGLLGLRHIPLVGRQAERDALWSALEYVAETGRTCLVGLSGPLGTGKTHLAEWLACRAHELGAAETLSASWSPRGGADEGFAPMVAGALGCQGLDAETALRRVTQSLRQAGVRDASNDAHALVSILHPPNALGRAARFGTEERRRALVGLLQRHAQERPLVLRLEDVAWGTEGVALIRQLLRDRSLPALVVLTFADEDLPEAPGDLTPMLSSLDEHLELGPLPDADQATLLGQVLGLAPALAANVQGRTQGNPLLAVQLVEDWAAQGLLEPGADGLHATPGAELPAPTSLKRIWDERLDALLAQRPAQDAVALELAALTGTAVHAPTWRDACGLAAVRADEELVDELLRRNLARHDDEGWMFVHPLLRSCLERRARDHGRWAAHNDTFATLLQDQGPRAAAARGRHLLEAGHTERALADLTLGVSRLLDQGDFARAQALAAARSAALETLQPPSSDPAWGDSELITLRLAASRADTDGLERARATVKHAQAQGWNAVLARSLVEGGRMLMHAGDLATAHKWLGKAESACILIGDRALTGLARELWASCLSELGQQDEAHRCLLRAWEDHEAVGDRLGVGGVHLGLSFLALSREDLDGAEEHASIALEQFTGPGAGRLRGSAMTVLGDIARGRGDPEAARTWFQRTLARSRAAGHLYAACVAEVNLALTSLEAGQPQRARQHLDQCLPFLQERGAGNLRAVTLLIQANCAAAAGDLDAASAHLDACQERLGQTRQVHRDLAILAELLAETPALTARAVPLAQSQRAALS
jgi:tetratricopeptide (TPR) repeat protein